MDLKPVTVYELITLILSLGTVITGFGMFWFAKVSNETNKNISRRQGVIDLHFAWSEVKDIGKNELITANILKAINALGLTATLWNNDVIEKNVLFQSYWYAFRDLFDTLNSIDELIPGKKITCRNALTKEIRKAYDEMERMELNSITQTKL